MQLSSCGSASIASCIRSSAWGCSNAADLCRSLQCLSQQQHYSNQCGSSQQTAGEKSSDQRSSLPRKSVVFLGTPQYASTVLDELMEQATQPDAEFHVSAVVTRPLQPVLHPAGQGGVGSARAASTLPPSPVEQAAHRWGLHPSCILRPHTAKDSAFLEHLESLRPDVCVTAAYGCILPQRFLDIPRLGTLNIHPSLLPKYRGAAPVQRALQEGCRVTGVTLAFTVLRCDAGPILSQQAVEVGVDEQAPELTHRLFSLGSQLLMQSLPAVLRGSITPSSCTPQDETQASYAPKLSRDLRWLDPTQPALAVHNHVRAFAGWPGTRLACLVSEPGAARGAVQPADIKLLLTRVMDESSEVADLLRAHGTQPTHPGQIVLARGRMLLQCGHGTWLEVLQARWAASPRGSASGRTLTGHELMAGLGRRSLTATSGPNSTEQG